MLYDTALLRTFVAICDFGSFTKAAGEVHLTQSAVSLHVKRLEEQVGARLIARQSRGIRLTEQGEVLLSYARRILALHKEAEHELARDAEAGKIRLGVPEYFDLRALSSLLRQFTSRHPEIRLHIELGIGPEIAALLDEGELDLVIVSHEIHEGEGIPLYRERRIWAGSRSMRLKGDEAIPLALYPPFCRWRQLALEELDKARRSWQLTIQSAGTAGILAALEAGLAISVFPNINLPKSLKPVGTELGLPRLPDFNFVLRRGRADSAAVDELAAMIVNFFQLSEALTNDLHRANAETAVKD